MAFVERPFSLPTNYARVQHTEYKAKHYNIFADAWNWTTQDSLSFYTSLLALFTGALVIISGIQIIFLIRADITARRAAIAARRAANASARQARIAEIALTEVERPYIFIWGLVASAPAISFGSSNNSEPKKVIQDNAAFIYSVSNRGKLTAVIENVSIACGYDKNGQYPRPFTKGHETSQCWRYVSSINGFAEDGLRTYAR